MGIQLRQRNPGHRIVRVDGFAVDHLVPSARATRRYFLSRCRHEGRSKAILSSIVGAGAGLSAERSFVLRTLSTGIVRNLRHAITGADTDAAGRATMIVLGLLVTALATISAGLRRAVTTSWRSSSAVPVPQHRTAPIAEDELVSVVVASVGRPSVVDTVKSVLAQSHRNLDFIVVDNRPSSGTVQELVTPLEDPRLRIVAEPARGVSAARNRGIACARGRIVAFTDDDALPDTDWIERIVATFRDDRSGAIGAVTGRVIGTESATVEQEWFEQAKVFDKGTVPTVWTLDDPETVPPPATYGVHGPFFPYTAGECGSGNNMAFRMETLESIGGFDERLGTGTATRGGEDLDVYRSTILDGWGVYYQPAAIVRHYHRDNMADLREQSYGYGSGMAASMTKLMLSSPRGMIAVVSRFPRGMVMLLSPDSSKNANLPADWPRELTIREILGYLAGPVLYVRSRRSTRT